MKNIAEVYTDKKSKVYFLKGLTFLAKSNNIVESEQYDLFLKFARVLNLDSEVIKQLLSDLESGKKEELDINFDNKEQSEMLLRKSLELAVIDGKYDDIEKGALLKMSKHLGLDENYIDNLEIKIKNMDWLIQETID